MLCECFTKEGLSVKTKSNIFSWRVGWSCTCVSPCSMEMSMRVCCISLSGAFGRTVSVSQSISGQLKSPAFCNLMGCQSNFLYNCVFLSVKIVISKQKTADPVIMPPYVAFYLVLHCVCQST